MAVIHIGYTHNSGPYGSGFNRTYMYTSPAEACTGKGIMQRFDVYWKSIAGGNVWFGIFYYTGAGTDFKCRAAIGPYPILGAGWQVYNGVLALSARLGDSLGWYTSNGSDQIARGTSATLKGRIGPVGVNACVKGLTTTFGSEINFLAYRLDGTGIPVNAQVGSYKIKALNLMKAC